MTARSDEDGTSGEARASRAPRRSLGIDAAGKHGWVGVVVDELGFQAARLGTLRGIIEWAEPIEAIGVDIPIGHVAGRSRRADLEARAFIGARSSSVFAAPPAEVLGASSYAEANKILAARSLPMLSRQAWALVPKINEAATVAATDARVVEVHPEVCFCEMASACLTWSKKTWNGLLLRRRLLADAGIVLPDVLPEAGRAAADDIVDAAAAAWSARRIATGTARSIPDPPEEFGGRKMGIWC